MQKKCVNQIKYDLENTIMILIVFVFDFYELNENLIGNYEYWKNWFRGMGVLIINYDG